MKFGRFTGVLCALALVLMVSGQQLSTRTGVSPTGAEYVRGHVLVGFQPGFNAPRPRVGYAAFGGVVSMALDEIDAVLVVYPDDTDVFALSRAIAATPGIRYAEPDYVVHATYTPNDPSWGSQWGPQKISCPSAWDLWKGDPNIIIAIVDTGINYSHPDLSGKVTLGWNYVANNSNPMDDNGHGTHCAGIAAANTNNGVGVAGVSFNCGLMAVKVLDSGGSGSDANCAAGINYAASHGAHVISMSFGSTSPSTTMQSAVNNAWSSGVVVCAAAGNNGNTTPFYPAYYTNCIAVGSTTSSDSRSSFSNYGTSWVDVAAPGSSIYSTYGTGYSTLSGTSMACPHVAGCAGLLYSKIGLTRTTATAQQVRNAIEQNCDAILLSYFKWGRVNLYKALQAVIGAPTPTSLALAGATGTIGQTVNLTATLTKSSDGTAIAGRTVAFTVAGSSIGSFSTDSNGVATAPYTIPESVGTGTIATGASFSGDSTYAASSASGTLTVNKASTTVTVSGASGQAGQAVSLTAALTRTTDNAPLSGKTLTFKVNGVAAGTPTTDSSGSASVSYVIPPTALGPYPITVDFAGDSLYLTSSGSATLNVSPAPVTVTGNVTLGAFVGPAGQASNLDFRQPGTTNVLLSAPIALDGAGNYSVANVPSGTYDVSVKFSNWLRLTLPNVVVAPPATGAVNFMLTNGDANNDNIINLLDLSMILANFGSAGPSGDLNWSGGVDLLDLSIVLANFGKVGN